MRGYLCLLGLPLSGFALLSGFATSCHSDAPSDASRGATAASAPREPLRVGDPAPKLEALSHIGYTVRLDDFDERPVLVDFCAAGLDPTCTALARALRDRWLGLNQRLGMILLVVPTAYTDNRAFASSEELPFLVIADPDGSIAKSFGVNANASAGSAAPIGFLVSPERKISHVFANTGGKEHTDELTRLFP